MSKNPLGYTLLMLFMCYVFFVVVFFSPLEKINAGCTPVRWPGKVVSAFLRTNDPAKAATVDAQFETYFQGCRRWVWNLAYAEEYRQHKKEQERQKSE